MRKTHPIYLDKNENLYGPSHLVYEFVLKINKEIFSYYSRNSINRISESILKYLKYDANKIIISYGGEDLLWQITNFIHGEGEKKLLIADNSWWYYRKIAEKVGLKIKTYKTVKKGDYWENGYENLLKTLKTYDGKYVLLCSPNNPTGERLLKNELSEILKTHENKLFVLDEAYWGFDFDEDGRIEDYNEFLEEHPNLIILRTFSKFFALAGVRIGFALYGKKWQKFNDSNYRYLGYNKFSEEIVMRTLRSCKYYHKIARRIMKDREKTYNLLKNFDAYTPFRTYTNFIIVKINNLNLKEDLKKALTKKNIVIKWFSDDDKNMKDFVRITIGKTTQMKKLWKIFLKTALKYEKDKKNIPIISKIIEGE